MNPTTAPSTTPMGTGSTNRPESPEEWADFWTATAKQKCMNQGLSDSQFHSCEEKLRGFFLGQQQHPRAITSYRIRAFLTGIQRNDNYLFDDMIEVMKIFYCSLTKKYPAVTKQQLATITTFSAHDIDRQVGKLVDEHNLRKSSSSTIKSYSNHVTMYLEYLNAPPTTHDRKKIESYLLNLKNVRKLAPRTINQISSAIASFYREVVDAGATVDGIPRMKPGKSLPKVYGEGDIGKILGNVLNIKHRLLLMLVYGCGLRLSEIRVLEVNDIDRDRKVIRINGKGAKQRDLPLDDCFIETLDTYLTGYPDLRYLFEGRVKGEPYARRTIQKIYDSGCEKSKIHRKGGIHSLRHTYATHLHEQGVDINIIKRLLGHSSVKTTQIYTHVSRKTISKIRSPLASIIPKT